METAISTLTVSNGTSQPSSPAQGPTQPGLEIPQIPLLTHYFHGASDPQSEQPLFFSIQSTLRNLLGKEAQELKEQVDTLVPKVTHAQQVRKSFREWYGREQLHLLEFLESPLTNKTNVSQVLTIVKRFGRADYSSAKTKVKDLVLDLSCNSVYESLQTEFNLDKPATFLTWTQQTKMLIDRWKLAASDLEIVERRLETQFILFSDIQKRVQMLLVLPNGEGYEALLASMEAYLKAQFQEHTLESTYQCYLLALKRLLIISDAMATIRTLVNTPLEPMCPICFSEPVSLAYEPCGHTLCIHCSTRQGHICPVCRTPIRDKLKLYFS